MHLFKKVKKNEHGLISVEASIALTAFLFFFIMFYSFITIFRAQTKINVAINNVAKELSEYSYVYGLTGIKDSLDGLYSSADETKGDINQLYDDINNSFNAIQTINTDLSGVVQTTYTNSKEQLTNWDTTYADISKMKSTIEEGVSKVKTDVGDSVESVKKVKSDIEKMAENPQELMFGLAKIISTDGLSLAQSRLIADPISRALVKKHLKRFPGDNSEACLKSFGIVPGSDLFGSASYLNGLDFSDSILFPNRSNDILIVVKYKIKIFQFLPVDYEFNITQTAVTQAWINGDGKVIEKKESTDSTDGSGDTPKDGSGEEKKDTPGGDGTDKEDPAKPPENEAKEKAIAEYGKENIDYISSLTDTSDWTYDDWSRAVYLVYVHGGPNTAKNPEAVIANSKLSEDQIYSFLKTHYSQDEADFYRLTGKVTKDVQVPRDVNCLNKDGTDFDWDQAKAGGYVLKTDGTADKEKLNYDKNKVMVIDRYGPENGRYTSPVVDGKPYSYDQRSLPYVQDDEQYHQYKIVGDLNDIYSSIENCDDPKVKKEVEDYMKKQKLTKDNLVTYTGEIAGAFGEPGGGTQWQLPLPVNLLVDLKVLERIK